MNTSEREIVLLRNLKLSTRSGNRWFNLFFPAGTHLKVLNSACDTWMLTSIDGRCYAGPMANFEEKDLLCEHVQFVEQRV